MPNESLRTIYHLLFHIGPQNDEFGFYYRSKDYDPFLYGPFDRRAQRKYRAQCIYNEKQKMLSALIEAGLPRELFLPKIDTSIDSRVRTIHRDKNMDSATKQKQLKEISKISRGERKARDYIYYACATYNTSSEDGKDTQHLDEFYHYLLDMWKEQSEENNNTEIRTEDGQKSSEDLSEDGRSRWWLDRSDSDDEEDEESAGDDSSREPMFMEENIDEDDGYGYSDSEE